LLRPELVAQYNITVLCDFMPFSLVEAYISVLRAASIFSVEGFFCPDNGRSRFHRSMGNSCRATYCPRRVALASRRSLKAPGRSVGGSWFECQQRQESFILSEVSGPAVERAEVSSSMRTMVLSLGTKCPGRGADHCEGSPELRNDGDHHMPSYREEGQMYL
jgi:hypothetical protein